MPNTRLGWIAEIPTFQNFNHVLQALDRAKLSYAENDIYPWQDLIAYTAGARVERGGKTFYCKTPHNDSVGSNPQDPLLDTSNSYWVNSTVFSSQVDAFTNLDAKSGVLIDRLLPRSSKNLWEGSDLTINNLNSLVALTSVSATDDNLVFGNVGGKIVVINVGNAPIADGRDISIGAANKSYELYHEGHRPTQAEVSGTIPTEPADGKLYARRSSNWVEVSSTTVSTAPPPPVKGNGQGWYNLDDGQFYVDIDDGDSSQWVVGNPPTLPELKAQNVQYDNTASGLSGTSTQATIDELAAKASALESSIGSLETNKINTPPEVVSASQSWGGVPYTDPDALGGNPSATIYPDGTIRGRTDNGTYTKFPDGRVECRSSAPYQTTSGDAKGALFRSGRLGMYFPVRISTSERSIFVTTEEYGSDPIIGFQLSGSGSDHTVQYFYLYGTSLSATGTPHMFATGKVS